jgi:hypothetical protein
MGSGRSAGAAETGLYTRPRPNISAGVSSGAFLQSSDPDERQPWRSCSEMLFEEKIWVWIVVKTVYLGPSGTAIKLESVWQGAVRIEPKRLDR